MVSPFYWWRGRKRVEWGRRLWWRRKRRSCRRFWQSLVSVWLRRRSSRRLPSAEWSSASRTGPVCRPFTRNTHTVTLASIGNRETHIPWHHSQQNDRQHHVQVLYYAVHAQETHIPWHSSLSGIVKHTYRDITVSRMIVSITYRPCITPSSTRNTHTVTF